MAQTEYVAVTLSVVPTSRVPPGMRVACVGDGAVLGNWQAEHAVPLDYSMGSHSTSFVIPSIAKEHLEFSFILQNVSDNSFFCAQSGPRHQIIKEGLDVVNGSPYFPIPEGGLSCKLRITAAPISAAALGALCQRPAAAYYETASAVRHTTAFASSPDRSGSQHARRVTTGSQGALRVQHTADSGSGCASPSPPQHEDLLGSSPNINALDLSMAAMAFDPTRSASGAAAETIPAINKERQLSGTSQAALNGLGLGGGGGHARSNSMSWSDFVLYEHGGGPGLHPMAGSLTNSSSLAHMDEMARAGSGVGCSPPHPYLHPHASSDGAFVGGHLHPHASSDGAFVGGRTVSLGGAAPAAAAVAWPYPPLQVDQLEANPFDDSSHARRTMRHYTADAVDPAEESDSDVSDHLVFGEGDACTSAASSTSAPSPTGTGFDSFDHEDVSPSLGAAAAASSSRFFAPAGPAEHAEASGDEGALSGGLKQRVGGGGASNNSVEAVSAGGVLESGRPPRPPSSGERKPGSSRRSLEQVEPLAAGGSGHGSGSVGQAAAAAAAAGGGGGEVATPMSSRARRRLALVLVGLPARGKTFTSRKLARYLRWLGHTTKHFNVGNYRREISGKEMDASFFDSQNQDCTRTRDLAARLCMEDMLRWMEEGGQVGIYDATNSTRQRRDMLAEMCRGHCKLVFLETISNDPKLIQANIEEKIHNSADYAGMDPAAARLDFAERVKKYEAVYEPIGVGSSPTRPGGNGTYIKLIDTASGSGHMQVNKIQGYLPGRIVSFLLNISYSRRCLYFARHGETEDNVNGVLGGDGLLSASGEQFAINLTKFIEGLPPDQRPRSVWISSLKRTADTVKYLRKIPKVYWRVLDELDAGNCDGMTYEQVSREMPEEYEARQRDKLRYRYPRGESYLDVIQRLESVIVELERQSAPVLVIAHQAVVRCLYAYIMDKDREEIPYVEVPLHTLICLRPGTYGTVEERIHIGPSLTAPTSQPPPQRASCDLDPSARQASELLPASGRRVGTTYMARSSVDELNARAKQTDTHTL